MLRNWSFEKKARYIAIIILLVLTQFSLAISLIPIYENGGQSFLFVLLSFLAIANLAVLIFYLRVGKQGRLLS